TPVPQDSAASFNPPTPNGCGTTVYVDYAPYDGPLQNASNVWAYIGRNGWLYPSNHPMVFTDDAWSLAYEIPEDTYELNVSFADGTNWDNNEGANWTVPVTGCGGQPAAASLSPAVPQGCVPVKFSYEVNAGPLMGATAVYAFVGRNGWQTAQHVALTNETGDLWSGWYAIPDDTWELNYVFHDEKQDGSGSYTNWDNNSFQDWLAIVAACVSSGQPHLAIVQPGPATNVAHAVADIALEGTANLLTGHLQWTNRLNGAAGALAYATNWSIAAVPLAAGVNLIRVFGTNSTVNPNHGAADAPTDPAYVASQSWSDGQNGGAQFKAWSISGGATAALAVSNAFCSFATNSAAWALQASGGGFIQAIRPFAAALQPGDEVSFLFENGGVDGGLGNSSVGVAFENRFGQRLAEFKFEGNTTNYVLFDTVTQETGIPWSNGPQACSFEMLAPLAYRLTVNGQPYEGDFAEASDYGVAQLRFWNWNAGDTDERTFFVGALSVTGAPLPVLTYSAETAVTRAASTNPVCRTEAIALTAGGFVATVSSLDGLSDNVWQADALTNGAWNWSRLPTGEYELVYSNNTVVLLPVLTNHLKLISIGAPGGSD
ncbi:MAG: hypothetical protein AB7V22_04545, partial [Kiritimatiellia bacterium]